MSAFSACRRSPPPPTPASRRLPVLALWPYDALLRELPQTMGALCLPSPDSLPARGNRRQQRRTAPSLKDWRLDSLSATVDAPASTCPTTRYRGSSTSADRD